MTAAITANAAVSQDPLILVEGVAPNMLLTLDDSGSMRFAFSPDNIGGLQDTRRAKSSDFNPMYYNPDIKYEIPPFFDEDGNPITLETSFNKAYHNGFDQSVGEVNLRAKYQVSWDVPINKKPSDYSYDSSTNYTLPTGRLYRLGRNPTVDFGTNHNTKGVAAYYYKYTNGPNCSKDDDNCYTLVEVPVSELKENFAVWYSFYRNRALATLSAAAIAFSELEPNVRISWQALNGCNSLDSSAKSCGSSFGPYTKQQKGKLYSWLRSMPFDGGTPLRASLKRAGDFLKTDKAWSKYPKGDGVNNAENTLACRPSYHVLMTDGMWNGSVTIPSKFSHDNTTITLPDKNKYTAKSPYKSSAKNTLADLAMHYWATDLKSDLGNNVPTFIPFKNIDDKEAEYWDPRNNPATWQHMSNFIVGLALTSSLTNENIPWEGGTHEGVGYQNLLAGTAWPTASSGSINNVYDLWHAAINSRGEFYSVDSPEDIVKAFRDILSRIADRQSTAALPEISSEIVEEASTSDDPDPTKRLVNYFYQSSFDSSDWRGEIEKVKSYSAFINGVRKDFTETVWRASDKLPNATDRKIYMAGNSLNGLVEFNENNASKALQSALSGDNYSSSGNKGNKVSDSWQERLKYIRGDRSKEDNPYRVRTSVLGDFLGSRPVVVSGVRYLENMANKIEGNTKYTAFSDKQKAREPMLYIGGNAGMLHAFDANTGEEKFAFVPTAVFEKLSHLADPKYSHRYYVDGSPVVADVYDGSNNSWRTVLIGTLGAGGKGIFALDVTDPKNIKLLWEKGETSFGTVKLGYSFSKPTVARLHNGKWAVVTGNGYEASSAEKGKAALYLIDAISGDLIKSLDVQGKSKANGLATPKLVDYDADGIADYAYAGDLQGNLWRFDLLGESASETRVDGSIYGDKNDGTENFKVSYGGKPMFTAEVSYVDKNDKTIVAEQPITAPPTIVRHPSRVGYLIVVGTGKYFEVGDNEGVDRVDSIYGIWDDKTKSQSTSEINISREKLVQQKFLEQVIAKNEVIGVNREARIISSNPVNWKEKKGWYLDLWLNGKLTGERVVDDMVAIGGTILFSSLVPDDDPCAHGAGNWLYAINPATGGETTRHVFDTRYRDGNKIMVVSGIKFGAPGGVPLVQDSDGNFRALPDEGLNFPEVTGRQTWRVVPDP